MIAVLLSVVVFPGFCQGYVWDCPNCGMTNNSGNYCPNCAYPAPAYSAGNTDGVPRLYDLYPGTSTRMKKNGDPEGRWYSYAGPGRGYSGSGGYKTDSGHANSLTAYFSENGWVFAHVIYSTAFERYVYLPQYTVEDGNRLPQISALDYYYGVTNRRIDPSWGPGSSFNVCTDFAIVSGTEVKVFFEENDYVYAEFRCAKGAVRMWIPENSVTMK